MNALYIVGCGAQKLDHAAPAAQLYTGTLFRFALAYARSQACDGDIRILSGKHGLVQLHEVLEPYDVKMKWQGSNFDNAERPYPYDALPTFADLRQAGYQKRAHPLFLAIAQQLRHARAEMNNGARPVVMLGGQTYARTFSYVWRCAYCRDEPDMTRPLRGLGIGQQMKWLKENTP